MEDTAYKLMIELSREAGSILLHRVGHVHGTAKGGDERDIVTEADTEVSAVIVKKIRSAFPDHAIHSEEESPSGDGRFRWMIDPVDGTANFAKGIPHYSVAIALLDGAEPLMGVVYNPATNELYSFRKGQGAYLNGERVTVSNVNELRDAQALIVIGHKPHLWDWGAAAYRMLLERAKKLKAFGSSCLDLCFVGCGRADVLVYGTMTTADAAAGIGFLREAGGDVYTIHGERAEWSAKHQPVFATANAALAAELQPLLRTELLAS
jgi:myo-inositol-1(or 4)-monophosphatase